MQLRYLETEMSRTFLKCFGVAAILGASVLSNAQSQKWKLDYIGVEAGVYFPTSDLLRDRFGSSIMRFGLTPTMIRRTADWRPSFEFGFMGGRGHGDRFAVYPLTVGVQKSFGDPNEKTAPFVRAGVGVAYFDYDITKNNLDNVRGRKFGMATALEAGVISGDRFRASVRGYFFPKQDGIDFGGILISATLGVFKL